MIRINRFVHCTEYIVGENNIGATKLGVNFDTIADFFNIGIAIFDSSL